MNAFSNLNEEEQTEWLFERYVNLIELFREELIDETFTVKGCLIYLLIETENEMEEMLNDFEKKFNKDENENKDDA